MNYKIARIKGDGIGPEVVAEAVGVLDGVEAAAMRAYSDALNSSAQRVGVTADDAPAEVQQEAAQPTVVDADAAAEVQAAFAEQNDASQDDFAPRA